MSSPSNPGPADPSRRPARSRWAAVLTGAVVLLVVAAPIAYFALDDGSGTAAHREETIVDTNESVAAVRAALGQTIAAGSYESDTVSMSCHAASPMSIPRIQPREARWPMPPLSVVSPSRRDVWSAGKSAGVQTKMPVSMAV